MSRFFNELRPQVCFPWRAVAAALFVFVLLPCALVGQTTGTILGQVSDPSGAAVVGAGVTAENLGTGLSRKASTDAQGVYLIPSLPVGTYKITVEMAGRGSGRRLAH